MTQYLLAIDQGTTSSRAIIFTREGAPICYHQIDLKQYYQRRLGEQDPDEMWVNTVECCQKAINKAFNWKDIVAIGFLTNLNHYFMG